MQVRARGPLKLGLYLPAETGGENYLLGCLLSGP